MVLSSWTYNNNSLQEALPSSTQLKWPTIKKIVIVPLPAISQGASLNHRLYNFIASSRGSWANMFVARGLKQLELFYHPDLNCLSCSSHHTPSHLRLLIRTSQLVICCSELRNLHPSSDIFVGLASSSLVLLSWIIVCSIIEFWRHSWHVPGAFTLDDTLGERGSAGYKTLPKPSPTPISQVNVLLCWICLITNCSFQVIHLSKTLCPSASALHNMMKILLLTWNPQTKFNT